MTAWGGDQNLRDLLAGDPEVPLGGDELEACFSMKGVEDRVRVVFDRLKDLAL
jgi:hypothetical protein